MRDVKRIDDILSILDKIWKLAPDMRLGQILSNSSRDFERNPFYYEDDLLYTKLLAFYEKLKRN